MIREFSVTEVWFLVQSVRWTVLLALIAFVGGGIVGLIIAVLRVGNAAVPRALAMAYIKLFQGTPLLMQLYLVYFGSTLLGFAANAWIAAALGLTIYSSAFLAEIWRGCIQAVPRGQWDGARALALGLPRSCALSSCRKPCASPFRRPWGSWSRSSRARRLRRSSVSPS